MASTVTQLQLAVAVEVVRTWESLFAVGSEPELGGWDPDRAVPLVRDENGIWRASVEFSKTPKMVEYRYFIGALLDPAKPETSPLRVVIKWEALVRPRRILLSLSQVNGAARVSTKDTFGYYDGRRQVGDGWLRNADEKAFFVRIHGTALEMFPSKSKKTAHKTFRVKVVPFDVRFEEGTSIDEEEGPHELPKYPSFSETELSVLTRTDPMFGAQYANGSIFRNNVDYLVFRTRTVALEYLAFCIELYEENGTERVGVAWALPAALPDTYGKAKFAIINKHQQPTGQINIDYMMVSAWEGQSEKRDSMALSFGRHWKKRTTVEVGHRGMGNSYTKTAMARENTVHSLNSAAQKGADFVEFDVQLTKDNIAVIYHDFHVLVEVAHRKNDENEGLSFLNHHEMAVKDLKMKQLKLLHLEHCAHSKRPADSLRVTPREGEETEADYQPFPSLIDALRRVDHSVGFNIEIKYPMLQKDGLHECQNYFERNVFIDVILNDVYAHAKERRIIFSSFDPDICTLITQKQHRFPVLFLVVGATTRYVPFEDIRSDCSLLAVNYAAGSKLLGMNFHSEELLKDRKPVDRANQFHMVNFVWGDDVNQRENQDYFKNVLALDGIIYDRIGEFEARKNIFIVEKEAKTALFDRSAAGTPAVSRRGSLENDFRQDKAAMQKLSELAADYPVPKSPKRTQSLLHDCRLAS